jgi:hypothetical protein
VSMLHHLHPLLGKPVVDTKTGRVGILRAVCPETFDPAAHRHGPLRAWLIPVGGGQEWTTEPDAVEAVPQTETSGVTH